MTKQGSSYTRLLLVFVILAGLVSVLGYLGDAFWVFDLFAHFRLQYALTFLVMAAVAMAMKRWRIALAAGALLLSNVIAIAPPYFRSSSTSDADLTLTLVNVNSANTQYAAVVDEIRGADVIVILEVNPAWEAELRAPLADYPVAIFETRTNNFGIAVFSKLPSLSHQVLTLVPDGPPTIALELPGNTTLFATHPVPPVSADATAARDAQLAALAALAKATTNDVIVLGDLNATPWSSALDPLFDAGLRDTRDGYDATWPTGMWPLRIPIDHCLVSANFTSVSHSTGRDVGSDHFPVKIALAYD